MYLSNSLIFIFKPHFHVSASLSHLSLIFILYIFPEPHFHVFISHHALQVDLVLHPIMAPSPVDTRTARL